MSILLAPASINVPRECLGRAPPRCCWHAMLKQAFEEALLIPTVWTMGLLRCHHAGDIPSTEHQQPLSTCVSSSDVGSGLCSPNWLCQGCLPIELVITPSEEVAGCRTILPSALRELSQCCLHGRELSVSHGTVVLTKAVMAMTLGLPQAEDLGLLVYHREPQHHQMETLLLASLFV